MAAIAPNLTVLVGELVGARLIAHAGSLINLAKQPASTVQILGAEKALFRYVRFMYSVDKGGVRLLAQEGKVIAAASNLQMALKRLRQSCGSLLKTKHEMTAQTARCMFPSTHSTHCTTHCCAGR
jgi:hypothetical protein